MRATTRFPHARTTAFVLLTLAWVGAIPAPAATVDKLPDFISKVQLHNCGGVELTQDGKGVMLYRLPREVRDQLDMKTPDGKERSGATQMRVAVRSETRFVLNDGAKLSGTESDTHLLRQVLFRISDLDAQFAKCAPSPGV